MPLYYTPGLSEAAETDPGVALVEELLSKGTAEEVAPPQPVGPWRQAAGTLGDALTAAAAVRAGGSPPSIGAFAATQRAEQEEYRIARAKSLEKERNLSNQVMLRKADFAHQDFAAWRREKAAEERAAEEDRRIAARQKEADERDASLTLERDKREKVFAIQKSLTDAGLSTKGIIPSEDPAKLSWSQIVDIGSSAQAVLTGRQLTNEERLRGQIEEAKKVDPTLTLSGVSATGDDGKMNARFAKDPLQTLSPTDARIATAAGVPSFNDDGSARTPQEVMADVAELKRQDREAKNKERDARLKRLVGTKASATVGAKAAEHLTILQNADAALTLLSGTSDRPGGPIAGRIWPGVRYSLMELMGNRRGADVNREVTVRIQNIFNDIARIRSGAAVTRPEEIRLVPELPNIKDTKTTMMKKLRLIMEFEDRFVKNIQGEYGLEDGDLDYIGASLTDRQFLPVEAESGDMVIFGGDGD